VFSPATVGMRTDAAGTTPADPGFARVNGGGRSWSFVLATGRGPRHGGGGTSKRREAQEGTRWRAVATCRSVVDHITDQGLEGDGLGSPRQHRQR